MFHALLPFQSHKQPLENHNLPALQHANIFPRSGVHGPACCGQPVSSGQELAFAGSIWMWQVSPIVRLTDAQMFLNIWYMPNFTVGLVTRLKTRCLNLFVDPSVMTAVLEDAPISSRASKSYHNAKVKVFENILSNPDRFCNHKQQRMA